MKLLCLVLSMYVMLLSANPCCADNDCQAKPATKKEAAGKSPIKEKECPSCSPFFTCGSCVGFTVAGIVTFNLAPQTATPVIKYYGYQQPALEEITLAIWQPPKIS
jgi:hypothetical protein